MVTKTLSKTSLILFVSASLLFQGREALTPSAPRRHRSYSSRSADNEGFNNKGTGDIRKRRSRIGSEVFVSKVKEQTGLEAVSKTSIPRRRENERKVDLSPAQVEHEIISLGRKGRINQALKIYESIDQPVIRQVNAIIDACSRAQPVRLELAFDILKNSPAIPNVYTFGSLMSVCARSGSVKHAVQLLNTMEKDYDVTPNAVVYNTAVSACARADPPRPDIALQLLEKAKERGLKMSVIGYNAAISAASNAGDWQLAVDLLSQMEQAANNQNSMTPEPDSVSYGTVLSAFEKEQQWNRILEYASYMYSKGLLLDGLAITSVLHACQSLGLADEAVRCLNMMKQLDCSSQKRRTFGWDVPGARAPLNGPDAVAYLLAVSACARGGSWLKAIELLDEYCKTPSIRDPEIDANIFTAAMKGCEYAGRWTEAFLLLDGMRKNQIPPNEVALATAIGACATACAQRLASEPEGQQKSEDERTSLEPRTKALRLLKIMGTDETIPSPTTLVYNAAIRVCAEAHDVKHAFKLFDEMINNGVQPDIFTFGSLMTACERVGNTEKMSKVFNLIKKEDLEVNDVIYGAAISCCRKAGEAERAMLLLRKVIKEGMQPNVATFNTALMAQAEARNTVDLARIYKFMKSRKELSVTPNRQTFNIIIRAFADKKQPKEAEIVLWDMRSAGCVPDVDLYTLIVSAYERTGQQLQALRLMESMNEEGYAFYQDKVLNAAFKRALKMANIVGRRLSVDEQPSSILDGDLGDGESFEI